jgi:hypothetical protein
MPPLPPSARQVPSAAAVGGCSGLLPQQLITKLGKRNRPHYRCFPRIGTRPRSTHQLRVRKGPLALWFGGPGPRVSCWVVLIDASKANAILRTEHFFVFWKAHLIDQTYPRRHSANPPKEIHRVGLNKHAGTRPPLRVASMYMRCFPIGPVPVSLLWLFGWPAACRVGLS